MKLQRLAFLSVFVLAATGLVCWLLGEPVGRWFAEHFGAAITRASSDEIIDVSGFVTGLVWDGMRLFTAGLSLAWVHVLLSRAMMPHLGRNARWAFQAVLIFILGNLLLAAAFRTTLFWCALFQGYDAGENYCPFQVKEHILKGAKADLKIAIMGNSQANRQLKRQLLNKVFGPRVLTEDLHWPGSRAYDMLLVHRRMAPDEAQLILCYVSEGFFYSPSSGEAVPQFFSFSDLSDQGRLGIFSRLPPRKIWYGLLGDLMPAFRARDPLAQRIMGTEMFGIRQRAVNAGLGVESETQARRVARSMACNSCSDFEKQAFELFVEQCARRNQKIVLIAGQLNPVLGGILPPEMRADMLRFLRSIAQRYPNVTLIDNPPFQESSEYVDLTHVTAQRRDAFTRYMAAKLVELGLVPAPQGSSGESLKLQGAKP